jgi:hypothetical protein
MASAAAVGFRVKSGWATAVLVSAGAVVERSVVQLADPKVRGSEQPFHEVLGVHEHAAAKTVARLTAAVERFAAASLDALVARHRDAGHRIGGIGIVVGSTIDPAAIANDHIRAHAEEGRLFRTVIEDAARRARIPFATIPEKELFARAAKTLGRGEAQLKRELTAMGKDVGGSWKADDKAATLAAMLQLR